jgi:hypothetical protein
MSDALDLACFACFEKALTDDFAGVLTREQAEQQLLPYCTPLITITKPELLLSALEGSQTAANALDPALLDKARRWMEVSPHELRKAKSRLARLNIVRPLCQRPVRVEVSDVLDTLLSVGALIITAGGLIGPANRPEDLSAVESLRFSLSTALSCEALAALARQIRTDCPLVRIRQSCAGHSAASLRIDCPREFSTSVSRTVLSTLDCAIRRPTTVQGALASCSPF